MAIALLQDWENMGPLMQPDAIAYDINKAHSSAYAVLVHPSTCAHWKRYDRVVRARSTDSRHSPGLIHDNIHSDLHHQNHVVIQDRGP